VLSKVITFIRWLIFNDLRVAPAEEHMWKKQIVLIIIWPSTFLGYNNYFCY